jgi:hypothetical protein
MTNALTILLTLGGVALICHLVGRANDPRPRPAAPVPPVAPRVHPDRLRRMHGTPWTPDQN